MWENHTNLLLATQSKTYKRCSLKWLKEHKRLNFTIKQYNKHDINDDYKLRSNGISDYYDSMTIDFHTDGIEF